MVYVKNRASESHRNAAWRIVNLQFKAIGLARLDRSLENLRLRIEKTNPRPEKPAVIAHPLTKKERSGLPAVCPLHIDFGITCTEFR
jgi:hypothetical protein